MESKILRIVEKYGVEVELKYKKDSIVAVIYGDYDVKVIKCGFVKNLVDEVDNACKVMCEKQLKKDEELTERLKNVDVDIFPDNLFKTKK